MNLILSMKLSDIQHFLKSFLKPKKSSVSHSQASLREDLAGQSRDHVLKEYPHQNGDQRQYRVYLPKGYSGEQNLPLVMVLHGCHQTHREIQSVSGFDGLADEHDFILVYPYVTQYSDTRLSNCWGWWRPEHIKAGGGEVEDLWCIVKAVASEYSVDLQRVHLTGLSAGGGMAIAAMTVHKGCFASVAVVAGVSYGERAMAVAIPIPGLRSFRPVETTVKLMKKERENDSTPMPLFIVHSDSDQVVDIQAGKNLRDSWLKYFGFDKKAIKTRDHYQTKNVPWTHTVYGKECGSIIVETVFIKGIGHGWYGGFPGGYSFPDGPPISNLMWTFFQQHALPSNVA